MERYRIGSEASVYFVTFSVVDWLPVFVTSATCELMTESLRFCHLRKGLRVNAYVVMPTHFHAIVFHESFQAEPLQQALTDFRKFTGRRLVEMSQQYLPPSFSQTFTLAAGDDRERRFWQPTRHPVAIQTEPFWRQKFDYLHENPCRKGLVNRSEHWRYSSAGYWLSDGKVASEVPLSAIDW